MDIIEKLLEDITPKKREAALKKLNAFFETYPNVPRNKTSEHNILEQILKQGISEKEIRNTKKQMLIRNLIAGRNAQIEKWLDDAMFGNQATIHVKDRLDGVQIKKGVQLFYSKLSNLDVPFNMNTVINVGLQIQENNMDNNDIVSTDFKQNILDNWAVTIEEMYNGYAEE